MSRLSYQKMKLQPPFLPLVLLACSGCASIKHLAKSDPVATNRRIASIAREDSANSAPAAIAQDVRSDATSVKIAPVVQLAGWQDAQVAEGPTLQAPASQVSVESCVQLALASHPKLAAARSRMAAAQHRVPQVSALPDPMLDNMFWPIRGNTLQTAGGRMQNQLGLSQQVPWPEKLRTKAAIACREVQMAKAEIESIEREIAEAVRLAYYEVWFAQHATKIILENQQLVTDLIRIAEARYTTGGSQQDVLNAEIEREQLEQQLLVLASAGAAAEAELAAYLQQPAEFSIATEEELSLADLPTQLDALIAKAEQCNPELKGLAFQIQRDIQKQRLANLQRYPDFQLGTQYGFMSRSDALSPVADGNDMISFSVGVTLPVWRDKICGGINEAAAERANSAQLHHTERLEIAARLRRLLAEIDALDQQRMLFSERIIPRSEQALQITMSEYIVGKTTFIQLTDNYRELLTFQLQVARIEATLAARLAQLQRTVGCAL